jgi:hypothetical protein
MSQTPRKMATTLLGLSPNLTPPFLTILRLTPLLSTTASLTHAYMELITTSSFLSPASITSTLSAHLLRDTTTPSSPSNSAAVSCAKEIVAPVWFVNFFNKGVWSVVGLNSITLVSACANLWVFCEGLGDARGWYLAGLGAAVAHYAFVPLVAPSVERLFKICLAQKKGEEVGRGKSAVESVREWVGVHKIRMASVDVVAWSAFLVGVVEVMMK